MVFGTMLLAASIASLAITETTGKGVSDHVLSAAKGQDCRSLRVFKGEDVCQPESSVTVSSPTGTVVILNGNSSVQAMETLFEQRKQMVKAR
jgi:hypothetical protein